MKKLIFKFIFIFIVFSIFSDDIMNSVVKIYAVSNSYSYRQPWQIEAERSSTGSGVIIDGKLILTNAHVVTNNSFLQVMKNNDTKKYTAKVVFIGHECDLALLKVDDESFYTNTNAMQIGDLPNIQDKVNVYGFPRGGEKMSITSGIINRIEIGRFSHSDKSLLNIQIDAAVNPGNSGGPAILDNKIIGIVFQAGAGENQGYMIATPIIKHFFEDIKDKIFDGFPTLGVYYQKLENNDFKEYLGLNKDSAGVFITDTVYGSSCYNIIKPLDVLLEIDGMKIGNDGTILFRNNERINFSYLISQKYIGDKINVKLLRNKKEITLEIKLKNDVLLINNYQYEQKPRYFVFGGMLFAPLTKDYLINVSRSSFNDYIYKDKDEKTDELVVLQKVLAVDLTEGYHGYENFVIVDVNGKKPASLVDFIKIIESIKDKYLVISFDNDIKIIIDYKKALSENKNILNKYLIPSDRSL